MKQLFGLIFILSSSYHLFAQNAVKRWGIGAGISTVDFSGPITKNFFNLGEYKGVGKVRIGRYLNASFNAGLECSFGKAWFPAFEEYPNTINGRYTLKQIYDLGLQIEYKFNNGYIFKETAVIAPYLFAGIGANAIVDYDINTYFPFGLGFNIQATDWLTFQIQSAYKLNIDNSFDYTQHAAMAIINIGKEKVKDEIEPIEITDTDEDGIEDLVDECPFVKGSSALFGCPDSDGDGLGDSRDKCPEEKGTIDTKGCPMQDIDHDGIEDSKDNCPNEKGEKRYGGCPDSDGDGVIDLYDECIHDTGPASNAGCPNEEKSSPKNENPVNDEKKEIDIGELYKQLEEGKSIEQFVPISRQGDRVGKLAVYFAFGSDILSKEQQTRVDEVLYALDKNPSKTVKIKGYTDEIGSEKSNIDLSLRRAQNVWKYMDERGFDGSRVVLYGMGEYYPLSDIHWKNRRVEFEIVE